MHIITSDQTELTKADIALVKKIHEETGIFIFKGPETSHLAKDDRGPRWMSVPKIGQWKAVRSPMGELPESRRFRRIERAFKGSPKWPEGIPLGWWDVHRLKDRGQDEYRLESSGMDISTEEHARLRSLSEGLDRVTDAERKRDAYKKERARAQAKSPEIGELTKDLLRSLAVAAAQGEEARKKELIEQ